MVATQSSNHFDTWYSKGWGRQMDEVRWLLDADTLRGALHTSRRPPPSFPSSTNLPADDIEDEGNTSPKTGIRVSIIMTFHCVLLAWSVQNITTWRQKASLAHVWLRAYSSSTTVLHKSLPRTDWHPSYIAHREPCLPGVGGALAGRHTNTRQRQQPPPPFSQLNIFKGQILQ